MAETQSKEQKKTRELLEDSAVSAYIERLASPCSRENMSYAARVLTRNILKIDNLFRWEYLSEELTIRLFARLREQQYSPASLKTYLNCIKGIAERLWKEKRISSDDYQLIAQIKPARGSRVSHGRMLSKEELKSLFDYYDKDNEPIHVRDSAIFAVMYFCGLRRSEVVGLKIENIELNTARPSMRLIGKGNKERVINIPPSAVKRLSKWLEFRDAEKGIVFTRITRYGEIDDNHKLTGNMIYKICSNSAQRAGIANWSPHDARRTCASQLISAGVDLDTVRDYLGHSSIMTTQIYDKRSQDRLQDVAQKFDLGIDD